VQLELRNDRDETVAEVRGAYDLCNGLDRTATMEAGIMESAVQLGSWAATHPS
jgi:hypothetical protein